MRRSIILYDPVLASRSQLSRLLAHEWHVEPFDDIEDLQRFTPREPLFALVADRQDEAARVRDTLIAAGQSVPIVAFADSPDTLAIVRAVEGGAIDYLDLPRELPGIGPRIAAALERTAKRHTESERRIAARRQIEQLSNREKSVGAALAEGHTSKAIARVLGISPRTVEIHRSNILRKLDVGTSARAIRILIESGDLS